MLLCGSTRAHNDGTSDTSILGFGACSSVSRATIGGEMNACHWSPLLRTQSHGHIATRGLRRRSIGTDSGLASGDGDIAALAAVTSAHSNSDVASVAASSRAVTAPGCRCCHQGGAGGHGRDAGRLQWTFQMHS